jgi:predicted RNase H-like HicB family nuclease
MTTYQLYAESGPRHRKTMVHVSALLGCVAVGATTEEAIEATPVAIRAYLAFLARHGADVDPARSIELDLVDHLTVGEFLGNGSPSLFLPADEGAMTRDEIATLRRRVGWMAEEQAQLLSGLDAAALDADPGEGRPLRRMVLHVIGAHAAYPASLFGAVPGASAAVTAVERSEGSGSELLAATDRVRALIAARLDSLTGAELAAERVRSRARYTLRKVARRMAEHEWEHLAELARRRGRPL